MRGKANVEVLRKHTNRITPAYAGKRRHLHRSRYRGRDHPRLCGEKAEEMHYSVRTIGSPPPMRGKDNYMTVSVDDFRITPAYAGKSGSACLRCSDAEDHPRLCGEKAFVWLQVLRMLGSPPPMRGKVGDAFLVANRVRDHPRLCGEKHMVPKRSTPIWGSPPPMRGKAQILPQVLW